MNYCSWITVDRYCWPQYKNCIATQFTYCTTILQYNFPASFPCNTLLYIAIQFPLVFFSAIQPIAYKTRSQYTNCIAIQFQQPTCKPHCNTILQYNPSLLKPSYLQYKNCIAIQFSTPTQLAIQSSSLVHPRSLYHNTMPFLQYKNFLFSQYNLGSSPKTVSALKFIIIIFRFFFFFIYFQQLENHKKKYTPIFFFHFP